MSFFHRFKRRLSPPRIQDPDFGELVFIYISNKPERSYWEGEGWLFPPTGTKVGLNLLGGESGPLPESRPFYLALPQRFPELLALVLPLLDQVFRRWYKRPISSDIWQDVKFTGFGLDDPRARPLRWDMSFEATGKLWLGITIPFEADTPGKPIVDT